MTKSLCLSDLTAPVEDANGHSGYHGDRVALAAAVAPVAVHLLPKLKCALLIGVSEAQRFHLSIIFKGQRRFPIHSTLAMPCRQCGPRLSDGSDTPLSVLSVRGP